MLKTKKKAKPKPKAWEIIYFTRKYISSSRTAEKVQERQHDTENKPQAVRVYWLRFFRQCHNNRNRIVYIIFVNLLWLLELALPGFAVVNTVNIQLSTAKSWGGTHIITKGRKVGLPKTALNYSLLASASVPSHFSSGLCVLHSEAQHINFSSCIFWTSLALWYWVIMHQRNLE